MILTSSAVRSRLRRLKEYRVMNRSNGRPAGNLLIPSIARAAFVVGSPCGVRSWGSFWFEFAMTTESRTRAQNAGSDEA